MPRKESQEVAQGTCSTSFPTWSKGAGILAIRRTPRVLMSWRPTSFMRCDGHEARRLAACVNRERVVMESLDSGV